METELEIPPIKPFLDLKLRDDKIIYRRGRSTFRVRVEELHAAYAHHRGQRITTNAIRQFKPAVFDSKARPAGHSCNISLLFSLLVRLELAESLTGKGSRGDPFTLRIKDA
ncbi:MAG TPA: hypothetical protein DIT13_02030 [Verrucomicrobiales bacterium]|nr:hypothetical protein [Verrucomicrobiales bacterium]HRJ08578.1 hypothetical protein [Prosthecobacter sp.]HRK14489.1 hypothetical protein [Prosthecobacter sp.]